ncbi:hypothetical protein ACO2Q2_04045 [Dyella sp. KRB-257]|uniref:hypothetical protein n=1 Tax=Dyella sp. KRB-257 TaxID=3400915 RepID=UPI003C0AAE17
MSAGTSDSMYFRNAGVPSYGVDAAFTKPDDTFARGLNKSCRPRKWVPGWSSGIGC